MAFNLKKTRKIASEQSPLGKEKSLNQYNSDWSNTIDKEAIPNLNGLLDQVRGEGNPIGDETVESQMDATRKAAEDNKGVTTESQIEKRKSWFPHRQSEAHTDNSPMMPINALSEAYDAKYRKAYSEASLPSEGKRLVDKSPGSQMEGPKTKVPNNVPSSGTQLFNHPDKFDEMRSSLKSADAALFGIFYKAAMDNRKITPQENQMIARISAHKKTLLAQLQPTNPYGQPSQPVPQTQPSAPADPTHPNGDPHSEFYPSDPSKGQMPASPNAEHVDTGGSEDDVIIDQLLGGGTPQGGVAGEDVGHPNYQNVHLHEQQEIAQDPFENNGGQHPHQQM